MTKIEKWLAKGKENCKRGLHWWILDYGDEYLCPVCGETISAEKLTLNGGVLPPFNVYLVRSVKLAGVA